MNYRHAFHAGNFADVVQARDPGAHPRLSRPQGRALPLHRHPCRRRAVRPRRRRGETLAGMARRRGAAAESLAARAGRRAARTLPPRDRSHRRQRHARLLSGLAGDRAGAHAPAGSDRALRGASRGAGEAHRRARTRRPAQHRRHGRLCRAQRLSAAEGAARPRPDRPAVRSGRTKAERVEQALARALRKWPTGIYLAWRPIREAAPTPTFSTTSPRSARRTSCGSSSTSAPAPVGAAGAGAARRARDCSSSTRRTRCSRRRRLLMPWLAGLLARDGRGISRLRVADAAAVDVLSLTFEPSSDEFRQFPRSVRIGAFGSLRQSAARAPQARDIPAFGRTGNFASLMRRIHSLFDRVGNFPGTASNRWAFRGRSFPRIGPKCGKFAAFFPVGRETGRSRPRLPGSYPSRVANSVRAIKPDRSVRRA